MLDKIIVPPDLIKLTTDISSWTPAKFWSSLKQILKEAADTSSSQTLAASCFRPFLWCLAVTNTVGGLEYVPWDANCETRLDTRWLRKWSVHSFCDLLGSQNEKYCYIPRLSPNKTSTGIGWFLVTCPWSNSNVSRPRYHRGVACASNTTVVCLFSPHDCLRESLNM